MIPPTSIDGTDITGATIDGTDVQEITVDGQTVFTSAFSHFDDFDTQTFADYTLRNGSTIESSSNWDISNSELTHPDSFFGSPTFDFRSFQYDLSSKNLSGNLAVEMTISSYADDDMFGCGFVEDDGTTYVAGGREQLIQDFGLGDALFSGSATFPPTDISWIDPNENPDVSATSTFDFLTPFTFRLEYDDSSNQLELFVDGSSMGFGYS